MSLSMLMALVRIFETEIGASDCQVSGHLQCFHQWNRYIRHYLPHLD